MSERTIEQICDDLAVSARNSALEAASKVARLYGAPEEACQRILMLKGKVAERNANVAEPLRDALDFFSSKVPTDAQG